jgi:hypothetical protein
MQRSSLSFEIASHTYQGTYPYIRDSMIALVPKPLDTLKDRSALFVVADGWNVLNKYHCSQTAVDVIGTVYEQAICSHAARGSC